MKLQLPQVTLLIYNPDKDANLSAKVLNFVCSMIDFGAVKHLCSQPPTIECVGETVLVPFGSWEDGQVMQSVLLDKYFDTEFLLHVETDGYPVNVQHWDNDFLKYDYIGAPWPVDYTMNNRVGNGGCSLRSKKFTELCYSLKDEYPTGMSSDIWFCQLMYEQIRDKVKFAPIEVAQKWGFELPIEEFPNWQWQYSFGFHGVFPHLKEPLLFPEHYFIEKALEILDTPEFIAKKKVAMEDFVNYGQARISDYEHPNAGLDPSAIPGSEYFKPQLP